MSLQKHTRNQDGTIRKERADSLMKNLKKEYSEFREFNGNMKLGTLRDKLGVESLDAALKVLRKNNH